MRDADLESTVGTEVPASVYAGIALLSASALALEVILTRIFSFTIWYHFTYLTLNAALLGFCAPGVILAVWPDLLSRHGRRIAYVCTVAGAIAVALFLLYIARHPLEPDLIFKQPWRFAAQLLVYYCGVAIPFFLVGMAVVSLFARSPPAVPRLYFADLVGAGFGVVAAFGLIRALGPPAGALACAILMLPCATLFAGFRSRALRYGPLVLCVVLLPTLVLFKDRVAVSPSRSTYVGDFEANPGEFGKVHSAWNAISRIDVYAPTNKQSDWSFPQWSYDGNGAGYQARVDGAPAFYFLIYDSHNRSDIYAGDGTGDAFRFLDSHLLKTPYVIKQNPRVLVMGSGGGIDVFNALRNDAASVTAVELQPLVVELLEGKLAPWTGGAFRDEPKVDLLAQEARSFLKQNGDTYDLIQFTATDTWSAQSTGAYVLTESYLYTREAVAEYLARLDRDGVLCMLVWDQIKEASPEFHQPVNSRLISTYLSVLEEQGVRDPGSRIAILGKREWYGNMFTVPLLKNGVFTEDEMARLRAFAAENRFQVLYDPLQPSADNVLGRLVLATPQQRNEIAAQAFYDITPVGDDNPFFFNFYKWKNLGRFEESTWYQPMTGQLLLLLMLAQSALVGFLVLVAPLLTRKARSGMIRDGWPKALTYFLCVGAGFMFIEVSTIQRFVVFLGYPAYAFAITVGSLLVGGGLGSLFTARNWKPNRLLGWGAAALAAMLVLHMTLVPALFGHLLGQSFLFKATVTVLLQAPVGFALGIFMPVGLRLVATRGERWLPWAWAVGGLSGVLSSIVAILIAMEWGFAIVMLLAAMLYAIAAMLAPALAGVDPAAAAASRRGDGHRAGDDL